MSTNLFKEEGSEIEGGLASAESRALEVERKILAYLNENPKWSLYKGVFCDEDRCRACAVGTLALSLGMEAARIDAGGHLTADEGGIRGKLGLSVDEVDNLEYGFDGVRRGWMTISSGSGPFFELGKRLRNKVRGG